MRIYDISRPLRNGLAAWPGDVPFQLQWTCKKSEGASVNVSQIACSVHTGTHIDAPFHFAMDGKTVDALPLEPFIGPAQVVDVRSRPIIRRVDIERPGFPRAPRVLFRTDSWIDDGQFPEQIPVLDRDVPGWLADLGVILIGVDVPSVDELDSKELPIHHALNARGIFILESLDLTRIAEGVYELCALPLKLVGADGAPVRAVLREINSTDPSASVSTAK